ncbi:MAG: hypothetical protein QF412_11755 [Planctomycetota bacterium]|jgi:predicted regulator of Ras-like GTPase activity (Roadblock/LC7/MglB family)|nr:hypothetical protein [Planctomycetota bacterium]
MKVLERFKMWRELKVLRAKAIKDPSPSTYIDLGQVFINTGNPEKTLEVAEDGLCLFPDSEGLQRLRKFAIKNRLKSRIENLRRKLNRSPHAGRYQELARLHLEVGDDGAAEGICYECTSHFPEESGTDAILGELLLSRFRSDLKACDGRKAIECLERVVSASPGDTATRKKLAELLFCIGASDSLDRHLDELRDELLVDRSLKVLFERVKEEPSAMEEDLQDLLEGVEKAGRLTRSLLAEARLESFAGAESLGIIRSTVSRIFETPGVTKVAYIKGSKALVKGDIEGGGDAFLQVVRVLASSAQRTSRRLDMGDFSKGVLEGDFGQICVCRYGDVIAAVLCGRDNATDVIVNDLQGLLAASLYTAGMAMP